MPRTADQYIARHAGVGGEITRMFCWYLGRPRQHHLIQLLVTHLFTTIVARTTRLFNLEHVDLCVKYMLHQ